MTFDEVVGHFDARRVGSIHKACCPAHDDDKASLTISENGDKILLHCFAGCATEASVAAKGMKMQDLFANSKPQQSYTTYLYRDLQGEVRYRKQRTADKRFFFAKADGHGGWVTSAKQNQNKPPMSGVTHLLYRLNELREQSENAETADMFKVYICEGEKDADRLWSLGLPATTNDTGAGNWPETLTQQLKSIGATPAICLADNDNPGRAHMQAVAQSCLAAGIEARIVELPDLPPSGDVSDYLDAGHTAAELVALCNAATVYN